MHTNTNKLLSGAIVASMVLVSWVSAASIIGSGSVVGSGSLTTDVTWDDTFPGTATGTVNGLTIKAKIQPTLSMVISGNGEVDLGTLSSSIYSSGTVAIEVGTNAVNGAVVTASSTNAGLKNLSDSGQILNSLNTDGTADSYKFSSSIGSGTDSTISGFAQSASLDQEVNDTIAHELYSSNKPQALNGVDDFNFTVAAKPNAQSPSGIYEDIVAVSVIGKF